MLNFKAKPGFICLLTERMALLAFLTHLTDCKGLFNLADRGITKTSGLKLKLKPFGLEIGQGLFIYFPSRKRNKPLEPLA